MIEMSEEGALVVQGGVATVAVAFLQTAVLRMIPYAVPSLVLLLLDLLYGVKAARFRKEKVRVSTAVRRSITKLFSYVCWLVLASTLALSFQHEWLEWTVLGLVYANELASIVGNYLETKGFEFSIVHLYRWLIKLVTGKFGEAMSDEDAGQIIKPKRDPKTGRFVKR